MKERKQIVFRGLLGLVIGGAGGGIVGSVVIWLVSSIRENPEEPAWIFAGTMLGLTFGLIGGSMLGLLVGLFTDRAVAPDESMLKSRSDGS